MTIHCRFDDFVEGRAYVMAGLRDVVVAERVEEVPALLGAVDDAVRAGACAAGFLAYEAAPAFDDAFVVHTQLGSALPLGWFGIFAERRSAPLLEPPRHELAIPWRWEGSEATHAGSVAAIRERIADGWTYQVNLTERRAAPFVGDPFVLYRQLAHAQRGAHHGYLATDDFAICCGSPELFFSVEGSSVRTRPMKGTAPRGRFPKEDEARRRALVGSEKERAENVMIVDLLRNDLSRIADVGGVSTTDLFTLERYPTVWQMTSEVTARVSEPSLGRIFAALFPCGSVTGAPKASTMAIIAALEGSARGPYCGAFGWADGRSGGLRASFAVPIRTAVVDTLRRRVTYGVGSGVTADSSAAGEWGELGAKAAVLDAPTVRPPLLETVRYDPEQGLVHLEEHLARMAASAEYLGYRFDRGDVGRAISEAALPVSPARLRILLDPSGATTVEIGELTTARSGLLCLGWSLCGVHSEDRRLFHKTADRERYGAHWDGQPSGIDDVVLWNERHEVTETTTANVVVLLDGAWWTPPLDAGLLPGIGRALALERGEIRERTIAIDELATAQEIALVSSVRGWRRARLAGTSPVAAPCTPAPEVRFRPPAGAAPQRARRR